MIPRLPHFEYFARHPNASWRTRKDWGSRLGSRAPFLTHEEKLHDGTRDRFSGGSRVVGSLLGSSVLHARPSLRDRRRPSLHNRVIALAIQPSSLPSSRFVK